MNHTNDNEEEQDLTAAAGEGNTKQAVNRTLQTYTKREGFYITVERKQFTGQMFRRNAENFKSDESKRGASNRIRSVSEYGIRNKQGFLLFFRGNLDNFNPY